MATSRRELASEVVVASHPPPVTWQETVLFELRAWMPLAPLACEVAVPVQSLVHRIMIEARDAADAPRTTGAVDCPARDSGVPAAG